MPTSDTSDESLSPSSERIRGSRRVLLQYIGPSGEALGDPVPLVGGTANFEPDSFESTDSISLPMASTTYTQTMEFPITETNPRLMELLLGELPKPTWIIDAPPHRMEVWNLRVGKPGPDGKIPHDFDGRFLCGPHDENGNHIEH